MRETSFVHMRKIKAKNSCATVQADQCQFFRYPYNDIMSLFQAPC